MRQASLILSLILLLIVTLTWFQPDNATDPKPWQIIIKEDGNSQVFNLHLGQSKLSEAQTVFRDLGKAAVFTEVNKTPVIEVFFDSVNLAGLSAKVIAIVDIPSKEIEPILSRAVTVTRQPSGAKKHELAENDSHLITNRPIRSLSYIPSVSIDKDTVKHRFGKPNSVQVLSTTDSEIWLYPAINMKVIFNPDSKTVLYFHTKENH